MLRREFIFLIAGLMSLTAFAIDIIMPALSDISATFSVLEENRRQAVVLYYMLGLGIAQLFFGPLSDRFGRKPVLLASLVGYFIMCVGSAISSTMDMFLLCRFLMGVCSGGPSVMAVALIRDRYKDKEMAQILSLAMSIFIVVPIIAPLIGQLLLLVISWQALFYLLAGYSLILSTWIWLRLNETAPPPDVSANLVTITYRSYKIVAGHYVTLPLMLASGILVGLMFSYLSASQQIFVITYNTGKLFPLYFAILAVSIILSAQINAKLVMRYGLDKVIRSGMILMVFINLFYFIICSLHELSLHQYLLIQFSIIFTLGLIRPNLMAAALTPHPQRAGTASAFGGFMAHGGGAVSGYFIASRYDGNSLSLAEGNIVATGIAFAILLFYYCYLKKRS